MIYFKFKPHIFILSFCAIATCNAQTFLCVSDKATGFKNNKGTWVETHFTANDKFILKWQNSYWNWTPMGSSIGSMCNAKNEDVFSCDMIFTHLIFNKRLMRFAYTSPGGYALEALQGDTPYMVIGKCSPI